MSLSKLNTLWDDYLEQLDKNPLVTKVPAPSCSLSLPAAACFNAQQMCELCTLSRSLAAFFFYSSVSHRSFHLRHQ